MTFFLPLFLNEKAMKMSIRFMGIEIDNKTGSTVRHTVNCFISTIVDIRSIWI